MGRMTKGKNLEAVGVTLVSVIGMILLPLLVLGKLQIPTINFSEWDWIDAFIGFELLRIGILLGFLASATFIVAKVAKMAWRDK